MISDDCKLRMSDERYTGIMSNTYLGIFGCKYDDVGIPFSENRLHKEVIGVFIVCLDFSSILVMMFFFSKINTLNNEFLQSMDDLRVQMKDFGIKLDNVKLDRYSQGLNFHQLGSRVFVYQLYERKRKDFTIVSK